MTVDLGILTLEQQALVAVIFGVVAFATAILAIRGDTKSRNFSALLSTMQELNAAKDAIRKASRSDPSIAQMEYELACNRFFNVVELAALSVNRRLIPSAGRAFLTEYLCMTAVTIKRFPPLHAVWVNSTQSSFAFAEFRKFCDRNHYIIDSLRKDRQIDKTG